MKTSIRTTRIDDLGNKRVNNKKLTAIAMLIVFPLIGKPVLAAQGVLSLSTGMDISTGTYGTDTAIDVTYVPVTGKYETDDWIFKLTVPYISITGPGNVIPDIGQAIYEDDDIRTDSGMGDVVATASYSLINSGKNGTVIDIAGKIKFATADKYRGLGSGANDYSVESSVYKIYDRLSLFGTIGYKTFGQSTGYTLNNVFYGSLGTSRKIAETSSIGLIFDYRQPTSLWGDPQEIWTVFLNKKINTRWKTQFYYFKGTGNASPDFGGGAMLTQSFR